MNKLTDNIKSLERAEKLIEINRFREAIPFLVKAMIEDPQDDWVLCSMSMCFSKIGDNEKSLEYAEKALINNPQSEWAYRLKGILFLRKGQPQECLKYAQKAVELEPENELALANLVWAFLHNSKVVEANRIADTLLEISPDSATHLYMKGVTESHLDNLAKSVEYFHQSLAIEPNYAEARNALALVILKQSNNADTEKEQLENEGLNHLTDSVKSDPNNEFVINNVKTKLDNSGYYFILIYLLPLFLLGWWVTPIVTIIFGLCVTAILISLIRDNHRRLEKLPPEMKNLLKIRNYASYLRERSGQFIHGGIDFLKKVWIQFSIALVIFLFCFFSSQLPFHENFYFNLKLLFWGNYFWLFHRLTNFNNPKQTA